MTKKKSSEYTKFRINNNAGANINEIALAIRMIDYKALDQNSHYTAAFTTDNGMFTCYIRKGTTSIIIDIERA